jgi:hypothetical protein
MIDQERSAPAAETPAPGPGIESERPQAVQPFRGVHVLVLFGITMLAGLLRLLNLAEWSLWVDEAHTWRDATLPLGDFLDGDRAWYPTTYLTLRWLLDAGVLPQLTEGWLRLPFAFCGIVSVPLLAFFGNLLVGRRAALLAALFLAINPWHIYWSQNARGYVLVFFFAVLSAGTFWLGVLRRSSLWLALGVALTLVGASCHPTSLSLLPVFLAYPVLARGNLAGRRFWLAAPLVAVLVMVLPHLLEVMPPFQSFQRAKSDASFTHLVHTTAFYFRVPLLCAALTGVWLLFQTRIEGRVLFLACWALVPLLALAVVGVSVVKVTARYAFCALPAVMLLAGAASVRMAEALAAGLGRSTRRSRLLPAAVLPAILCLDMAAYDYLYFVAQYGDRGRWREARDVVLRAAENRQFEVWTVNQPSMLYYLRPNHYREIGRADSHAGTEVQAITYWDVFESKDPAVRDGNSWLRKTAAGAQTRRRDLFVVVTMPELVEIDRDQSLRKALREQMELTDVLPCWVGPKDETIYVWRPRAAR